MKEQLCISTIHILYEKPLVPKLILPHISKMGEKKNQMAWDGEAFNKTIQEKNSTGRYSSTTWKEGGKIILSL